MLKRASESALFRLVFKTDDISTRSELRNDVDTNIFHLTTEWGIPRF